MWLARVGGAARRGRGEARRGAGGARRGTARAGRTKIILHPVSAVDKEIVVRVVVRRAVVVVDSLLALVIRYHEVLRGGRASGAGGSVSQRGYAHAAWRASARVRILASVMVSLSLMTWSEFTFLYVVKTCRSHELRGEEEVSAGCQSGPYARTRARCGRT